MKLYRLLLHLYPSSYRAEYGDEMSGIFGEELRQNSGWLARCGLWLAAFVEVFSNAAAVHWEIARRDLRSAVRSLVKSPGFAVTALLLVTIGIGANAAIFTLADFVLVRPLPFSRPERLVKVYERHSGYEEMELSPANYRDFKAAEYIVRIAGSVGRFRHEPGWRRRATAVAGNLGDREPFLQHAGKAGAAWPLLE